MPDLGLWWTQLTRGGMGCPGLAGSVWAKQHFTHSLSTQEDTLKDSISFSLLKFQAQSPAEGGAEKKG